MDLDLRRLIGSLYRHAADKVRRRLYDVILPRWDVRPSLSRLDITPSRHKAYDELLRRLRNRYRACREYMRTGREVEFFRLYCKKGNSPSVGMGNFMRLVHSDVTDLTQYSEEKGNQVWDAFADLLGSVKGEWARMDKWS